MPYTDEQIEAALDIAKHGITVSKKGIYTYEKLGKIPEHTTPVGFSLTILAEAYEESQLRICGLENKLMETQMGEDF